MKLNCGPTHYQAWEASKLWHRWFAWYPVRIGDKPWDSRDCRWLEWVERQRVIEPNPEFPFSHWEYRELHK